MLNIAQGQDMHFSAYFYTVLENLIKGGGMNFRDIIDKSFKYFPVGDHNMQ